MLHVWRSIGFGVCVVVAVTGLPRTASAQLGFVEGIFKEIDHLNVYYGANGRFSNDADVRVGPRFRTFGFEASFELDHSEKCVGKACVVTPEAEFCEDGIKCVGKAIVENKGIRYELEYDGKEKVEGIPLWELSLAINYSQIAGFENRKGDSLELSGTFEQVPEVGLYLNLNIHPIVALYGGVRTGLVRLLNFEASRVIAADSLPERQVFFNASGTTFVLEGALGIGIDLRRVPVTVFAELDWSFREFPSLQWSVNGGAEVPKDLPRRLNANGRYLIFGIEFAIK